MTHAQAEEQLRVVQSFPSTCKVVLLEAGWRQYEQSGRRQQPGHLNLWWPAGVRPPELRWESNSSGSYYTARYFTLQEAWLLHMLAGELRTSTQLRMLVPGFTDEQEHAVTQLQRDQLGLSTGFIAGLEL